MLARRQRPAKGICLGHKICLRCPFTHVKDVASTRPSPSRNGQRVYFPKKLDVCDRIYAIYRRLHTRGKGLPPLRQMRSTERALSLLHRLGVLAIHLRFSSYSVLGRRGAMVCIYMVCSIVESSEELTPSIIYACPSDLTCCKIP